MDPKPQQICRFLDWDTQFFGKRIAQVTASTLSDGVAENAIEWCRQEKISCLYYLAPCEDIESIRLAEIFGFHLVDIRMTYELSTNIPSGLEVFPQIRLAQVDDIPILKETARLVFRNTRFFNDGNFPVHLCEQLYMVWIEKSCLGYAQAVWVAEETDIPVGFISCHIEDKKGVIGLVGVHPSHHHQGLGRKLVMMALSWFASHKCPSVSVVTQGNNLAAQRLYESYGFTISSVKLWYHRWFEPVA
ncbi:MAG: hypothetical protein A2Y88_02655 [Chloroflexi bacterium RBG_13_48_10]|nr:MAG: hypothetical protein A2Y88_02655 [Chloroflexi bacterium RBG_13_48_10]